ncbi:class I SAM-dependent methyltransferase [Candidatus Omnitrophota bacterium]
MEIDWIELWRELVTARIDRDKNSEEVKRYKVKSRKKSGERPDPLLDFVLQKIDSQSTVLDVGTGGGRWTIPIAKIAESVTAVEPSETMISILRENIAEANLKNIQIVQAAWEDAIVEPHDIITCAHTIYASREFAAFIHKMESHARKRCYLAVRLPPHNGVLAELSLSIYGNRHDSPNAIIAYNALYSMGIYANVFVEDGMHHWINSTFEEAFTRAKRHLRLESSTTYDELVRDTLNRRLNHINDLYVWPDGMSSALLWWMPKRY